MSYAIRNDKQGYRMIGGESEVGDEEYFSETPIDIVPLPPTKEEILESVNIERDRLLSIAAIRISPLQDAEDLGVATEADTSNIKLWKQYRISLNRVSEQIGYPSDIQWPVSPL